MPRVFTANVVSRDPVTGQTRVFRIGDEVPENLVVGDHAASGAGTTKQVQSSEESPANDERTVTNEDGTETTIVTPEYEQDEDEEDEDLPPYEEWSKEDLYSEVKGRGLTGHSKSTHEELVEALKADDAENPEED